MAAADWLLAGTPRSAGLSFLVHSRYPGPVARFTNERAEKREVIYHETEQNTCERIVRNSDGWRCVGGNGRECPMGLLWRRTVPLLPPSPLPPLPATLSPAPLLSDLLLPHLVVENGSVGL